MALYTYSGYTDKPNTSAIYNSILNSGMTDKEISGIIWDDDSDAIQVTMVNTLSSGDETTLEGLVSSHYNDVADLDPLIVSDQAFSKTLSYSIFKSIVVLKDLEWQYFDETDFYCLHALDGQIVYQCKLYKSDATNTNDFETNYKPTANKKIGVALDPLPSATISFKGDATYGVIPHGTTANIDFQLTADRFLNGANFYVQDATIGDYVAFQVVDVDNLIGYGAGLVLSTWIYKWYIPPNQWCMMTSPTAGFINAGFYLRAVYTSVSADTDPKAFVNYHLNMKL